MRREFWYPVLFTVVLAGCRATPVKTLTSRLCAAEDTVSSGIDAATSGLSSLGGPAVGLPTSLLGALLKGGLEIVCAPIVAAGESAVTVIEAPQAAVGILPASAPTPDGE